MEEVALGEARKEGKTAGGKPCLQGKQSMESQDRRRKSRVTARRKRRTAGRQPRWKRRKAGGKKKGWKEERSEESNRTVENGEWLWGRPG